MAGSSSDPAAPSPRTGVRRAHPAPQEQGGASPDEAAKRSGPVPAAGGRWVQVLYLFAGQNAAAA